ncbi:MAG TPA: L-threonylcarbamoyladenylate synthase [bacterium]|nr:L-threonylcarbamoyladenylate synthase [bacterium]HMW32556.1 L-threonylcarbamoyladenylate synthase [bacterium]HMW34739.1 L-threonylcarbamoyladenylate synthase [bacterium]HMY34745.1 L-threonylcarbamoyladenylate synthase [bacterium]HMZ03078.1 L-threonylcarbamoyladenylate synthase [bacterium]
MKTLKLKPTDANIRKAARILQKGGLVALPTETVYGLAANAMDAKAVRRIFKAKGRPSDNPLIVHIADRRMLSTLVDTIPEHARLLMRHFWPGPLTLVLRHNGTLPLTVTAGLSTVAVRLPGLALTRKIIRLSGVPLAAPSANRSGRPSPTQSEHVLHDLDGRIEAVIEGGIARVGIESTVVDVTGKIPVILRPGHITIEDIRRVCDHARLSHHRRHTSVRSPGMKYRHYAPDTPLQIITPEKIEAYAKRNTHLRLGIMTMRRGLHIPNATVIYIGNTPTRAARHVFAALRKLDGKVDRIVCEALEEKGIGHAVMNRLKKAASKK